MGPITFRAAGPMIGRAAVPAIALAMTWAASGQTPAQDGQWTAPFDLPLIAIHSAMLPTGKVLLFSAEHGVPGIHAWLLDPISLGLTNVPPPAGWNPDCAGHSFLADGRLLVAGGTLSFNPLLGSKRAYLFDPYGEQWVRVEDMRNGRWYPTNVTLPDGRIATMSGRTDVDGELNPDIEAWDAQGGTNWSLLGQKTIPFYPYLHVMPSGLVFRSGPDQQTETFDPATAQWTPVASTIFSGRYEAPSILLPPTLNRVMVIGGYPGSGQPTSTAEIIDFGQRTPQWIGAGHMSFARMEHNAVLLPDGRVLVVGGRSNSGQPANPVLTPEVFDPKTGSWGQVAAHQVPRMYHATAILLPDGRVLSAGGDFQPSGEIYSPPYLFRGPRPVIQSAPTTMAYGSGVELEFTSSTVSNTVALIRLSGVTHSVNMGQRYVLLAESVSAGAAVIPTPATASIAPPGFYMLFVVDENGVPSEAATVQVRAAPIGDVDGDGLVGVGDLLILLGAWGPCPQCPPSCPADFDGDCQVAVTDLLILLANWS